MTGATLYCSEESSVAFRNNFEVLRSDDDIQGNPETAFPAGVRLNIVPVTTTGSVPGSEILRLNFLEPFAQVVAFRHLHSIAMPYDDTSHSWHQR
jgi:hypothetical protein